MVCICIPTYFEQYFEQKYIWIFFDRGSLEFLCLILSETNINSELKHKSENWKESKECWLRI